MPSNPLLMLFNTRVPGTSSSRLTATRSCNNNLVGKRHQTPRHWFLHSFDIGPAYHPTKEKGGESPSVDAASSQQRRHG